ncbi:MAG: 30S ribosomal protein S8 [Endomicrobium sp.]|jgi:small subunit ribosomal protein S8|nr:30S ribosomal protein S8 [Endomicrobium sp.]
MVTDQISDMFVRIRNANAKLHEKVDIPFSKFKFEVARVLKEEGYIMNYRSIENHKKHKTLRIYLKYTNNKNAVLQGIKRVSKPSLRVYRCYVDIPKTVNGLGTTIVSTSKGLMTDKQAKRNKIGGEILGYVW